MLSRGIGLVGISLVLVIGVRSTLALTELKRDSIVEPRLENAFGASMGDNVNQQIQFSVDITNNQTGSHNFVYLVQIINDEGIDVSQVGLVDSYHQVKSLVHHYHGHQLKLESLMLKFLFGKV